MTRNRTDEAELERLCRAHIQALVDAAPPLSQRQLDILQPLFASILDDMDRAKAS